MKVLCHSEQREEFLEMLHRVQHDTTLRKSNQYPQL